MKPWIALTGGDMQINDSRRLAVPLAYFAAIERAGGFPFAVGLPEGSATEALSRADGLLLTGGGDVDPALYGQERHPKTAEISAARDRVEIELARAFIGAGKPVLAICRGVQALAVALGGALHQHVPDVPGVRLNHSDPRGTHRVRLAPGSVLRAVYVADEAVVNTRHHQAIMEPPEGFAVTAVSEDGLIEGIERGNIIGVQWHPEGLTDEGSRALFSYFVRMCAGTEG